MCKVGDRIFVSSGVRYPAGLLVKCDGVYIRVASPATVLKVLSNGELYVELDYRDMAGAKIVCTINQGNVIRKY